MRWLVVLLCLACWVPGFVLGERSQQHYYSMVQDILDGIDYYQVLGVERTAELKEIRKAFRTLSRQLHPDKQTEEDTKDKYILVTKAYEYLTDPSLRHEFDLLLRDGVPWHEKYYGKYAHKFGAPSHDIRKVLLITFTVANVLHYFYLLSRWKNKRRRVAEHPYYLEKLRQAKKEKEWAMKQKKKLKQQKKPKQQKTTEEENENESDSEEELVELKEAFFHIDNLDKPKVSDLLVTRFLELPWTIVVFFYKLYHKYTDGYDETKEREKELMERFGLTQEQLDFEKERSEQRFDKFKQSTRYKQIKRYMKKRGGGK